MAGFTYSDAYPFVMGVVVSMLAYGLPGKLRATENRRGELLPSVKVISEGGVSVHD